MVSKLSEEQARQELATLPGWELKEDQITKLYKFKDFAQALAFVNRVGGLAETADHHPDIDIRYSKVILTLSTHSAGGLTEKDFELARQIDPSDNRA